jgi:hypothetical protein
LQPIMGSISWKNLALFAIPIVQLGTSQIWLLLLQNWIDLCQNFNSEVESTGFWWWCITFTITGFLASVQHTAF